MKSIQSTEYCSVILMCHKTWLFGHTILIPLFNSIIPLMGNQIQFNINVICVNKYYKFTLKYSIEKCINTKIMPTF